MPGRRVLAGLVATLLLAGWLAPALAAPRPDEVTEFVNEFLNALKAIFRVQDGRAVTSTYVPINVRSEEVIKAFGGADKVKEFIASQYAGSLGVDGNALAEKVVELLREEPERVLDYAVERYHEGKLFVAIAEIKNEYVTKSLDKVAYAWKEALQDACFVSSGRLRKNEILAWFIPASAAAKSEMKPLVNYLRENGIVVITDSESLRVLKTLDGAYRSRYGLDLIDSVADWYGISKDAEVRAAFRRAVDSGEIYNFIPDWPKPKQARLDLALQGFAEDSGLAVRLRDFVKRNWDLIAQVSGVAAKLAFDEWCRRNPPRSPEEAQLRQLVGRALDAYNVGVAALGEFRTALGFVRALKAAAEGTGVGAALAAATAGVSLLITALAWYHDWWIDTHTTYQLSRAVGGRYVVFTIKRPEGLFGGERLVVTVDGRELMSIRVDRAPDEANPRQACFVEGLFGWCVSKSACSGSVCVECQSATLTTLTRSVRWWFSSARPSRSRRSTTAAPTP